MPTAPSSKTLFVCEGACLQPIDVICCILTAAMATTDHAPTYALALETSSTRGRIALGRGAGILETCALREPRAHAAELLPAIDALCASHGVRPDAIGHVFVSNGPGSFTGLRIGVTVARMLALATNAVLVAVPTLDVIAQNALADDDPPPDVVVVLDAKRKHVFAAGFELRDGVYHGTSAPTEVDPALYLAGRDRSVGLLGEGIGYHRSAIEQTGLRILAETLWPPRVETVYRIGFERAAAGECTQRDALLPIYIRPPEAEEKWQERKTRGPNTPNSL